MSLYQGSYRRTCCSTRQPKKPGWYVVFYSKRGCARNTQFWDGDHWVYNKEPGSGRTVFDSIRQVEKYWAPIPKGLK